MRRPAIGTEFDITIDNVAFGGFGVGRVEGRVFFVHRVYPGEMVRARVYQRKRGVVFAEPVEIIEPSPYRRKAPCHAFADCGGCSWQNIEYEKQFEYKVVTVTDSLTRIGKLSDLPPIEKIPANREFRYRNKMEFAFGNDDSGEIFLGLHKRGRFDKLVPTAECLLMPEYGTEIIRAIERRAAQLQLETYNSETDSGLLRYATIRFSETEQNYLLSITLRTPERDAVCELLKAAEEAKPGLAAGTMVVNRRTGATAQGELEILTGSGFIEEEIEGIRFRISPDSFFQTNTSMARKFYRQIVNYAALSEDETVFDLYCGTGTIAQLAAPYSKEVIGIDNVKSAIKDAVANAKRNGIGNVSFIEGAVEKRIEDCLETYSPDVVIMDLPAAESYKRC